MIRSSNDDGSECMERTENINRQQPLFLSFDEILTQDSMARVIDRFVDVCNLQQMGFQAIGSKDTGRPAYSADGLSHLYVQELQIADIHACSSLCFFRSLFEQCFAHAEIGHVPGDGLVKGRGMVMVDQVRRLVQHDIVDGRLGIAHQQVGKAKPAL